MITLSDVGADQILSVFFNNVRPAGGNDLSLKLFSNDYNPADTDIAGDFVEVSGGGYAPKILACGAWSLSAANDPSDVVYADQLFVFTGAIGGSGTAYGYFVVDADGVLIWAERLATPFQPVSSGDNLTIVPKFQLSKGVPT
jgi:hypothetical protein